MSRVVAPAALLLLLAACAAPDPNAPGNRQVNTLGDTPWKLVSVNGEEVEGNPVVMKAQGGFINANGPCNVINANYVGEAPDFGVETLVATKVVCDRLGLESRMIEGLMNAKRAVVANRKLTITGDSSPTLVFDPA